MTICKAKLYVNGVVTYDGCFKNKNIKNDEAEHKFMVKNGYRYIGKGLMWTIDGLPAHDTQTYSFYVL